MMPMEVDSPMGGTTSADYQRSTKDFFIEEPATITTKQIAFYAFWDQYAAIGGLNMRIGTGSFVTYTDAAAVLAGSNTAMIRNDSAFSLARGRNTLNVDMYRTDTADHGNNVGGYWIVNYTCAVPTQGHGAENRTIIWAIREFGSNAAIQELKVTFNPTIPETDYFLNGLAIQLSQIPNSATAWQSTSITVERLSAEGGQKWESAYADMSGTDGEVGIYRIFSQTRALFKRWPGDVESGGVRMDVQTSRRYNFCIGNTITMFRSMYMIFTYHTITFTVSGTVSGSGSGTVYAHLIRARNITSSSTANIEQIKATSRSGNGTVSFTWYDDTENMAVMYYEDSTHTGLSQVGTAS
jgi:hypothetical protein